MGSDVWWCVGYVPDSGDQHKEEGEGRGGEGRGGDSCYTLEI